jgi:di/tricarboxylate transporter
LRAPAAGETLQRGDVLLVGGQAERAAALASLGVRITPAVDREMLAAADTVLVEVLVAPRSRVIGQTLRQVDFRSKYGLSVVAMWHGGRLHRTGVGDLPLRGSETLLVYGPRERLAVLQADADWVVLATDDASVLRPAKMRLALGILGVSLLAAVVSSWPTAAVLFLGALAMVLTGCLTMDEAYQAIEWRSVFLVGSMLPVGLAFSATGAARLLGDAITHSLGAAGPLAVVAGLFLATAALNQFIPGGSAVPAVLVPIAIAAAQGMGSNPRAFALVIAVATGTSMLTPFAHPVNVMVMGPGGYTFRDYLRAGLPLVITTLVAVLVMLPLIWGVR